MTASVGRLRGGESKVEAFRLERKAGGEEGCVKLKVGQLEADFSSPFFPGRWIRVLDPPSGGWPLLLLAALGLLSKLLGGALGPANSSFLMSGGDEVLFITGALKIAVKWPTL